MALFSPKVPDFEQIQSSAVMASSPNSSLSCPSNPVSFAFANHHKAPFLSFSECPSFGGKNHRRCFVKSNKARIRASLSEKDQSSAAAPVLDQEQLSPEVVHSIKVLKNAAKTRKVASEEILPALSVIEKAKIDPSGFFETLGGTSSPGRTWMLIYTAEKKLEKGRYFPLTAIQRFDAAGKRIENGVYLGSLGFLTFEGRLSWKKRVLAFIFERIRIKVGPFNPLEIGLGQKDDGEPSTKDPFFIWFYVDEEIAVARGRSGGTAFWCRCRRVANNP